MVESFKRYYNNSFLDGQRQEAYNLFLGNYIFAQGQPMLWDLSTDYYLHHADPRTWAEKKHRNYVKWYTPGFLEKRKLSPSARLHGDAGEKPLSFFDDYWLEYYRPLALSSFLRIFSFKMNSTLKYIPFRSTQEGRYDLSPFKVRTEADQDVPEKKKLKKEVTIVDPHVDHDDDGSSVKSGTTTTTKRISIQRWLQPINDKSFAHHGIMKEPNFEPPQAKQKLTPLDKSKAAQWTFTQVVHESLNPSVSTQEAEDYSRYISHPQTLPLVVSTETPTEINAEYLDYVNGVWQLAAMLSNPTDEDLAEYTEFLTVTENPLTVTEEDAQKKRYKAYRKWLRGKSLFKQQPLD
jgi:hypothetical protein